MQNDTIFSLKNGDIVENEIRDMMPEVLEVLLLDRTKSTSSKNKNIIWANENYIRFGRENFSAESQLKVESITGIMGNIIKPRALKSIETQKERTKSKAEVFTPTWIIKEQNDEIDKMYINDDMETYINRTWLEITCGEAPYIVSRYDMETGEIINISDRVGFIDRKFKKINELCNDENEWQEFVTKAYKSSYGFEWNGDSLLLARENLLFTYIDNFKHKWNKMPSTDLIMDIACVISYNIFQMDGLNYCIPLSEKKEKVMQTQMSLFDDIEEEVQYIVKAGRRVKVMNWEMNRLEFFDKGVK